MIFGPVTSSCAVTRGIALVRERGCFDGNHAPQRSDLRAGAGKGRLSSANTLDPFPYPIAVRRVPLLLSPVTAPGASSIARDD